MNKKAFVDSMNRFVDAMGLLQYPPSTKEANRELMRLLGSMATSADQIDWLRETIISHYNTWPGPKEIRAVFCSRFKPASGEDTLLTSGPIFERIQSQAAEQHERNKLPSGKRSAPLQLTDGRITADELKGVIDGR